ncbi:hypothetical protein D3C84_698580 [compost metagenome]
MRRCARAQSAAGQRSLVSLAAEQGCQCQQVGHRKAEELGDARLAEQRGDSRQVAFERVVLQLHGLSGDQQQGVFRRLQAQASAQLQQGFLVGGRGAGQGEAGLIKDQWRVEQLHPVEHLVEQGQLVLAGGIGREVVHQCRKFLRVNAMAPVQVAIHPQGTQGIFVEFHAQVVFAFGANRADDQGVELGEGYAGPALQADHALQAIVTVEGGFAQAPGFSVAGFDVFEVHGVVEFIAPDGCGGGRYFAVVATCSCAIDVTGAVVAGIREFDNGVIGLQIFARAVGR